MAPGRRLSMRAPSRDPELPEEPPRGRGKAQGLAVKKFKYMNNNQKPRVEFKKGLLKPVGPWAAVFSSEVARILRMNAPLAVRRWRKIDPRVKKSLHDLILEAFDVDLHLPLVRRAVNRYLGQRLKDFRSKLHLHYKKLPESVDKRLHPHEDVDQSDWVGMCTWFQSDEFKALSEKNTSSRQMMEGNHCCGSKPFVRYREELIDPETQELPGKVSMYHHTRFSKKKGSWVSTVAEQNYNTMTALQSTPTPADSTPLTEDQVYDKVFGVRRGYVHGLGHGQDPLPASSLSDLDDVEDAHRNAQEAQRRAEEAERRAQVAQMRYEESERRREEVERQTDAKFNAMQAQMSQMLSFLAQFQGGMPQLQGNSMGSMAQFQGGMTQFQSGSMMDLLMGARQGVDAELDVN